MSDTLQAVYDVRDGSWRDLTLKQWDQLRAWAMEQGIEPNRTYRWEIHLIDMPCMRVFEFEYDENAHLIFDPATSDAARRKPYDLPISSMPPVKPATPTPPQETP